VLLLGGQDHQGHPNGCQRLALKPVFVTRDECAALIKVLSRRTELAIMRKPKLLVFNNFWMAVARQNSIWTQKLAETISSKLDLRQLRPLDIT
jgi:hypothetical protein